MCILSSVPDERASCFCLLASDVRELTHSQWGLSLFSEALAAKQVGSLKKPDDCSSYGPVTSHCGPCPEPWRWVLLSTGLELSSTYLLLPCLQFFTWSPCTSRPWGSGWPEPRKVSAGPVPLPNCVRVVTSLLTSYSPVYGKECLETLICCHSVFSCVSLYLFLSSTSVKTLPLLSPIHII